MEEQRIERDESQLSHDQPEQHHHGQDEHDLHRGLTGLAATPSHQPT